MKDKFNKAAEAHGYHVHIYTNEEDIMVYTKKSRSLAGRLTELFPEAVEDVHWIGKVGPHTRDNAAISIKPEWFGEVVSWLQLNNDDNLSILIHPETGDELKDHEERAMWIGKPVPLNNAFFRPPAP